jgi:hypothetical protein
MIQRSFVFLNKMGKEMGVLVIIELNHLFKSIGLGGKILVLFYYYPNCDVNRIVGSNVINISL